MQIPLSITIGHNSSGEPYLANVSSMPHLFISYGDEEHQAQLYDGIIKQLLQLHEVSPLYWAIALESQNLSPAIRSISDKKLFRLFTSDPSQTLQADSNRLFIQAIYRELKRRQRLIKDKALRHPLIVVMDHVISRLTVGATRRTGKQFLECLLDGPAVGMHVLASSHQSYKNLLDQFMAWHTHRSRLSGHDLASHPDKLSLGSELVLSGEGLVFFRGQHSREYVKLYSKMNY